MKIAVIGSGISGLTAAHLLSNDHDVHVIESNHRLGGHTATIDVDYKGEQRAIDTGFIVFNDRTYPNFIKLLSEIEVESQPSSMSFSVTTPSGDFQYAGNSLFTLFVQKKNIFSLSFWSMLKGIVKFNRQAESDLQSGKVDDSTTLGQYLQRNNYSVAFRDFYLIPMGAAIWSASYEQMLKFPLYFFVRFFSNHGLLSIFNKPTWHVIKGGSKSYIPSLTARYKNNIRTGLNIESVSRTAESVEIRFQGSPVEYYDHVVIATHSDQALSLLSDPSDAEKDILGVIRYQENSVVLHTDTRLLPSLESAWSSWNYRLPDDQTSSVQISSVQLQSAQPKGQGELPVLTYNMNILQGFDSEHTYCVSLNADELIDESKIIAKFNYAHPQFDLPAIAAQKKKALISGLNRTSYCGAYWANGFHEDGVVSAVDVAREFGVEF